MQSNTEKVSPKVALVNQITDHIFNLAFFLEFALKVVALGWRGTGPSAYSRNPWNVADFILLMGSITCEWGCMVT
jgi:hypothetical protein